VQTGNMSHIQTSVLSHAARVRRLYKESLIQIKSYYHFRHLMRYESVLMRARFDKHKDELDMVKAKQILLQGESELEDNRHPQPFKWANSPGGTAYGRDPVMPDWVLDMWHPAERLQYPEYFTKREQRKKEYMEDWEKKYGKPEEISH